MLVWTRELRFVFFKYYYYEISSHYVYDILVYAPRLNMRAKFFLIFFFNFYLGVIFQ